MNSITNPDVLQAALYSKTKEDDNVNAKDVEVVQMMADDLFVLADKLESPNAKSTIKNFANKLSANKRALVSGGGNQQPAQPPPMAPQMNPMMGPQAMLAGLGQPGMPPTDGQALAGQ